MDKPFSVSMEQEPLFERRLEQEEEASRMERHMEFVRLSDDYVELKMRKEELEKRNEELENINSDLESRLEKEARESWRTQARHREERNSDREILADAKSMSEEWKKRYGLERKRSEALSDR